MGLMFDNEQGVCDWAENVICDNDGDDDAETSGGEDEEEEGEEGEVENEEEGGEGDDSEEVLLGSITDYDIDMTNSAGSNGAESNNEVTGWQGGSDWGGSWIDGVWYVFSLQVAPTHRNASVLICHFLFMMLLLPFLFNL